MKLQDRFIELEATGVAFFSQGDEEAFFNWLKSLPCVVHIEGRGLTLYIRINSPAVDDEGLRELIALFYRYGIDMAQLIAFDREEFSEWFRSTVAFWHKDIFGSAC